VEDTVDAPITAAVMSSTLPLNNEDRLRLQRFSRNKCLMGQLHNWSGEKCVVPFQMRIVVSNEGMFGIEVEFFGEIDVTLSFPTHYSLRRNTPGDTIDISDNLAEPIVTVEKNWDVSRKDLGEPEKARE